MNTARSLGLVIGALLLAGVSLFSGTFTAEGATYVVDTTSDSSLLTACTASAGDCSLRGAISNANTNAGPDSITFSIGSGTQTITPLSPLPVITGRTTINGTTQPGFAGTPIIEINGASAGAADGLSLDTTAGGSAIQGLVINRFTGISPSSGHGIKVATSTSSTIQGNYLGTNVAGTAALPNVSGLFIVESRGNIVGGTTLATRNLLSGNTENGIVIGGTTATGNIVIGNYIGTNAAGTGAVANGDGLALVVGAGDNSIGGAFAGQGNVISGNSDAGIRVGAALTPAAVANKIYGNKIGTAANGTSPLANLGNGIDVIDDLGPIQIGQALAGHANTIAFNGGDGVGIPVSSVDGITIVGNSIHSNVGLGIDLGTNGINANDNLDADSGANTLLNYPTINAAYNNATNTVVALGIMSSANLHVTVDVYSSAVCALSNYQGETYQTSMAFATDGSGSVSGSITLPASVPNGHFITLALRDDSGNTSEFSNCRQIVQDTDSDGFPDSSDGCPTTATPWPTPAGDSDCDGFTDAIELDPDIRTDPSDDCADTTTPNDETDDKWPSDFNDNQLINTLDLTVYATALNKVVGHPQYVARADLNQNNVINTLDLVAFASMLGKVCTP